MSDRFRDDETFADDEGAYEDEEALDEGEGGSGRNISRYMVIAVGALIGIILLGFILAIVGSVVNSDGVANFFRILRDFFIIVLALQGILICVALVVLVMQVTALINLLDTEIRPLIEETRDTITTVRGTTQFMSENVTTPVIRVASAAAGAKTLLDELMGIKRNINGTKTRR